MEVTDSWHDLTRFDEIIEQFKYTEEEYDIQKALEIIVNYYGNLGGVSHICLLYLGFKVSNNTELIELLTPSFFHLLTINTEDNLAVINKYALALQQMDMDVLTPQMEYSERRLINERDFKMNIFINTTCKTRKINIPSTCTIPTRLLILYFYLQGGYFETTLCYADECEIVIRKWDNKIEFSNKQIIDLNHMSYMYKIMSSSLPYNFNDRVLTIDWVHKLCKDKWCIDEQSSFVRHYPGHNSTGKMVELEEKTIHIQLEYEGVIEINNLCSIKIPHVPYTIRPLISSVRQVNNPFAKEMAVSPVFIVESLRQTMQGTEELIAGFEKSGFFSAPQKYIIEILLIPDDILEDPIVFADGCLDWSNIHLRGINHFYSQVDILWDAPFIDGVDKQVIANTLGVNNEKQSILDKLNLIEE